MGTITNVMERVRRRYRDLCESYIDLRKCYSVDDHHIELCHAMCACVCECVCLCVLVFL